MKIDTSDPEAENTLVDLTPLIDVVFLLLIFFIVTATFQQDERDLTVNAPQAKNGQRIPVQPDKIIVNVAASGEITHAGKRIDIDDLRRLIRRRKTKVGKKLKVFIRGDRNTALKHPVAVVDLCAELRVAASLMTVHKTD